MGSEHLCYRNMAETVNMYIECNEVVRFLCLRKLLSSSVTLDMTWLAELVIIATPINMCKVSQEEIGFI